jgi:prepilin-type N-terminal cleavage/methylation domain-containing protein/prepilin-type processing-associated H-X9-DG protein
MNATNNRRKRAAFTLVELLVVIAIIGILVALLLPAIQAAREAARRAQCQNHAKQIALAVLNYDSSKKKFPPGFVPQPSQQESWGWAVFVLPYLEETGIYDRLRPSPTFKDPVDGTRKGQRNLADVFAAAKSNPDEITPLQTPLAVFRCPSDATPPLVPCEWSDGSCKASNPTAAVEKGRWVRSFLGNNSSALSPRFMPSASNYVGSRGMVDAGCPLNDTTERCDGRGVLWGGSDITAKDITDGTSKTFMLGERDEYCLAGTWIGARNPQDGAEIHSSLWTLAHTAIALNSPTTTQYDTCTEAFSSAHEGGAYFAFCDGSVRFIGDDITSSLGPNAKDCVKIPPTHFLRCRIRDAANPNNVVGVYQRLSWRDDGEETEGY